MGAHNPLLHPLYSKVAGGTRGLEREARGRSPGPYEFSPHRIAVEVIHAVRAQPKRRRLMP